jgi:ribosomal protein S18 acetylase RimI-like enzyme
VDEEFEIRQIEAGDTVTGLSLGDADFQPLKSYLKNEAKLHQAQGLARTYGLFYLGADNPRKVLGYMTLVCGEIAAANAPEAQHLSGGGLYRYPQFPAVKLARLAVDSSQKGHGWGTIFVDMAVGISRNEIASRVGCRFLVVDAKQKSVAFYRKAGFTLLDTDANRERPEPVVFVDLLKVPGSEAD